MLARASGWYHATCCTLVLLLGACERPQHMQRPAAMTHDERSRPSPMPEPNTTHASAPIEVVAHMKFELGISLHVLATAEDHHALFVDWATRVRRGLRPHTSELAAKIIQLHEWQLGHLLRDYTGASSIADIAAYVRADPDGHVRSWAKEHEQTLASLLQVAPDAFGALYADFLQHYYGEAFGETWEREHWPLLLDSAERMRSELSQIDCAFLERRTGRRFPAATKLLLFPSSFSRPQHGYGFEQQAAKVVVYRVGDGLTGVIGTVYHELLHSLIAGWVKRLELESQLERLAEEPAFRADWEQHGRGSYAYPETWLEELLVHALGRFLLSEQGLLAKNEVANNAYCDYEHAIYAALFANFSATQTLDGFVRHALTHIERFDGAYRYRP